jgi:L-ascorbate metabolism protein UlaG (beta-lactamase superfamily)
MNSPSLEIRRLSWAGVKITSGGEQLVLDAIEGRDGQVQARIGSPRLPLQPITTDDQPVDVAVLTHLHKDHFDLDALKRRLAPSGRVVAPARAAADVAATGLNVIGVADGESVTVGRFRLTAFPAVDGFGWPQSSWLVEAGGVRIFHGGDTLFHGYWWDIAKAAGEIDVAFLPINGARIAIPGLEATGLPGVMTAEQAAVAGRLLKARLAVPIHYQEFDSPPVYRPDPDAENVFLSQTARQGVSSRIIAAGEIVLAA